MAEEEFRLIRDYIYNHCGLSFDISSKFLLEKRLSNRVKLHQLKNFKEYYRFLRYDPKSSEELSAIIDILTTNETYFFRESCQLKAFSEEHKRTEPMHLERRLLYGRGAVHYCNAYP